MPESHTGILLNIGAIMTSSFAIADLLKTQVPLFAGFPRPRLERLVDRSRIALFEPNEFIIRYGAQATQFCVVLEGTATVSAVVEGGARKNLCRLRSGATFGELAVMTGDSMIADLIAESRCKVLLTPISLLHSYGSSLHSSVNTPERPLRPAESVQPEVQKI
jgi:signal-transduction protein with cAMP-binding, CBS, and nucleotidyltransferase domain